MKILVTGGAGYLGSVLVRELLRREHHVRVLDNLLYGNGSLKKVIPNPSFELIQGDIRDMRAVVKSLNKFDAVIHLASIVGKAASNLDPRTTIEINYLATRNIAELCKLYEVPKFIFASTCTVYGAQPNQMITERSKVQPIDLYGETKVRSERAIREVFEYPTIFRMGTLFGLSHRMRFDLAINLFIAKALKGEKITVFGGNQTRPFLHVADAAEAFCFALENDLDGTYNVVWDNLTIMDMAKVVQSYLPTDIETTTEIVDKRDYKVSGEKINRLGFRPKRDIAHTVSELMEVFQSGKITDYKLPIYSNHEAIFSSKEIQQKVYTQGLIFS